MGNRFSRRRDAPVGSAETAATEQKTAEEPAVTQPAQDSGTTLAQEAVDTEDLEVVVRELVAIVACVPSEECVSEIKEVKAPELEPVAKDTPAPVQPEPVVLVSELSPPEPETAAEPKPVAEAQVAQEPDPEPVPEPEPTSNLEAEVEADAELISESVPAPAEALEQQTDVLTQEPLPDPVISSPTMIDLGVSDATPQPMDTPPSPDPTPALVDADEPSDIAVTDECQDGAEVSIISTLVPESEETSESLEKPMDVEAAGDMEQVVSDVNEETVSGLLQNLALKGNDLVADLIPTDVKIPDDAVVTDVST